MASERNKPIVRRDAATEYILSYSSMPADQLDTLLAQKFRASLDALATERQCAYCGTFYCDGDNFGTWQCAYHPGKLVARDSYIGKRYTCCGQAPDMPPCLSCDHAPSRIYEENCGFVFIAIPRYAMGSEAMRNVAIPVDALLPREPGERWVAQEFRVTSDIGSPNERIEMAYEEIVASGAVIVKRVDLSGVRRHPHIARLPYFATPSGLPDSH